MGMSISHQTNIVAFPDVPMTSNIVAFLDVTMTSNIVAFLNVTMTSTTIVAFLDVQFGIERFLHEVSRFLQTTKYG